MSEERVDVVIAGAGPTGLFLASQLRRRGHSCAVLERNPAPSTHSKALAIMPKTLALFERAGLLDAFLPHVHRITHVRFETPRRAAYVAFDGAQTPYPFVSILPQYKTEALLRERLQRSGGSVRFGHALESFETCERGIRAHVQSPGAAYAIDAAFLAGCDGVHSRVREQAGIAFPGRSYAQRALLADVRAISHIPPSQARVSIARSGTLTVFPMSADVYRVVVIAPDEPLPETPAAPWLQSRLDGAGVPLRIAGEPLWSSAFGVHRRVAKNMRAGSVLLAGDAVHAHSPVGGQGMNTGLQDAWHLAQAIGAVLEGRAGEEALEAYEAARLPAARAVVRRTDLLTRALAHPHPVMRIGREFLAPYIIGIPLLQRRVVRSLLTA